MNMKSSLPIYMALTLVVGAFSFPTFAQSKNKKIKAEEVKPKVKEKSEDDVEVSAETPIPSADEPLPLNKKSSSSTSSSASGWGQTHAHSAGIGFGQTFLTGSFGDYGEDKIALPDLFYAYSASHSFDMLVNGHYSSHSYNNRKVKIPGASVSVKAKLFQFDAFSPFALGGLGFYRPQISDGAYESKAKLTFGINLGVGGDLKLNDMFTVGVLVQYHNPFDVKQDNAKKVEGSYAKLLITGMYTF